MQGRNYRAGLLTALVVAALSATTLGCKQPVLCPALDSCGGPRDPNGNSKPPLGEWFLAPNHPSCTEDLYVPANDTRLGLATVAAVGTSYPEPALFDWCLLLVTGPGAGDAVQQKQPRFYYESGPIGAANVRYEDDGTYRGKITRTGSFVLDLPSYCIRAFGAQDGPLDPSVPGAANVHVCERLSVPIANSGQGEGSYRNVKCFKNPDDPAGEEGCLCTFDVTETGSLTGLYSIMKDNKTILHLPGTNFPQKATFCQEGDSLHLTGAEGSYLFDQRGLRTFDLVRSCGMDSDCVSGSCDLVTNSCK